MSLTNVTELTKGDYEFRVSVTDENNNTASGSVSVTVTQSKFSIFVTKKKQPSTSVLNEVSISDQNAPPKANAGGDQTVILPASVIMLNGSQSSDDLGIVRWKWTREPDSLAIGRVLGSSDISSVLMVTGHHSNFSFQTISNLF